MLLPTLFNNSNTFKDMPTLLDDLFLLEIPKAYRNKLNTVLPMDIEETETQYLLSLDAPGLNKEDIDVTIDKNILTVSINNVKETKTLGKYLLKERKLVQASRSVSLSKEVNVDTINASFINGVLNISIDKNKEEEKRKKILIS